MFTFSRRTRRNLQCLYHPLTNRMLLPAPLNKHSTGRTTPQHTKGLRTSRSTTRHDTIRHDTTRHDTTRHDTTRHDTTRHDTTPHWPKHIDTARYEMTRQASTRHYTVRHGTTVQSTTRHDTTRHGLLVERFNKLFLHAVCPEQNDPFQSISDMGKHWTLTYGFHSLDFAGGFQVIPAESHSQKLEL